MVELSNGNCGKEEKCGLDKRIKGQEEDAWKMEWNRNLVEICTKNS